MKSKLKILFSPHKLNHDENMPLEISFKRIKSIELNLFLFPKFIEK